MEMYPIRSFAELHRDTWALVRRAPVPILLLPALVWLPLDALVERVSLSAGSDFLGQWRTSWRLERLLSLLVDSLLVMIALAAVRRVAEGRRPTLAGCASDGFRKYLPMLATQILANLRVFLFLLLLVVPGIMKALSYALFPSVLAFKDHGGGDALRHSTEAMAGHRWRLVGYCALAGLMYFPVILAPIMLIPEGAPVWVIALGSTLINILYSLVAVSLALVYLDATGREDYALPAGPPRAGVTGQRMPDPPRVGVLWLLGIVFWIGGIGAAMVPVLQGASLVAQGDEQYELGNFAGAIELYREALVLDPEDAYAEYSLAYAIWYNGGETRVALTHAHRARDLDPDDPLIRILLVELFIELGDAHQAEATFGELRLMPDLREHGLEEYVDELEQSVAELQNRKI